MNSPKPIMAILVPVAVTLLALAGCARESPSPRAALTPAQMAACRTHVEEVYRQQNRAEIYRNDTYVSSTRDAPYSTSGVPGDTSAGLSSQYAYQRQLNDCYNATSGGSPTTP
jgi:hypothetical protein